MLADHNLVGITSVSERSVRSKATFPVHRSKLQDENLSENDMHHRLSPFIFVASLLWGCSHSAIAADRVEESLEALYDFNERLGDIVHDTSEAGHAIDLRITSPAAVQWRNGSLVIENGVVVRSIEPARSLNEAVKQSGELTIEAWITPANDRQSGPARIISLCRPEQSQHHIGTRCRQVRCEAAHHFDQYEWHSIDANSGGSVSFRVASRRLRSQLRWQCVDLHQW